MDGQLMQYGGMILLGMILGIIFFGGLWLTIRKMSTTTRPALLFMASVIVRSAVVLVAIWYFASHDAMSMALCLLGFIGIRLLATRNISRYGAVSGKRKIHS